jgi:hypothetical protein
MHHAALRPGRRAPKKVAAIRGVTFRSSRPVPSRADLAPLDIDGGDPGAAACDSSRVAATKPSRLARDRARAGASCTARAAGIAASRRSWSTNASRAAGHALGLAAGPPPSPRRSSSPPPSSTAASLAGAGADPHPREGHPNRDRTPQGARRAQKPSAARRIAPVGPDTVRDDEEDRCDRGRAVGARLRRQEIRR